MVAEFDAAAVIGASNSASEISGTITVGSGSDRVLVVAVARRGTTAVSTVTTTGSLSLEKLKSQSKETAGTVDLWGVVDPPEGVNTVVVKFASAATTPIVFATSAKGIAQAGGASTFRATAGFGGSSTTPEVTVTSVSGDLVVDVLGYFYGGEGAISGVGAGQTKDAEKNTANFETIAAISHKAATGTSTATKWTLSVIHSLALASVSLVPASEATSVTIEPPAAIAKAFAPAPTVSTTTSVTIEPPAAVAKAKAVAPAVSTVASVTVEPPAAVAKAVAPAPTVTAEGGEAPVVRRPNRKPPLALDVEVESAGGQTIRFPADSAKARFKPRGLSHGTQRGDGFTTASFSVSREIFREFEVRLLDTVRFVGHNGEVAYEGFVGSMPRTNDPEQSITINVQGWMTYLKGRQISPLIIDRRLSGWGDPSNAARAALLEASYVFEGAMSQGWQAEGTKGPAVTFSFTNFQAGLIEIGEAWFYAGGEDIGELRFDFECPTGSFENLSWHEIAVLSDLDTGAGGADVSADRHQVNGTGLSVAATEAGRKFASLRDFYEGASTGASNLVHSFVYPRIIGTHGLTAHGTSPEEGYYLSDILRYVTQTYYPKLTWAGEENQTLVTQCTRHDSPTDGYEFTQELNNLALWETNVWEDRKFHFYPADLTRYDWQIRTDDPGVTVQFQGDSIENFANGVSVSYTDVLTEKAVMLWPDENAELRDESETNPANVQGINNWTSTQVPWTCTEAEALQFGRAYLAEFNRPKRPGTYTISGGYIKDAAGHWHQGWKPRSSETVGIMDLEFDEPRLITATSWDQESLTLTLTVDAPPQLLEAVIARQQRALESRGLS